MSKTVRVAAVQFEARVGDRAGNLVRFERFVAEHAERLDLMVFPELFSTGYDLDVIRTDGAELADTIPGRTTELAAALAARHRVTLSLTLLERQDGQLYDTTALVTANGVVGRYRKTHLYPAEVGVLAPGDALEVVDVGGVKYGPMICFEHAFPDVAAALALRGAQILLIPSAVPRGYEYLLTLRTRARAQDNQLFAVAANLVEERPEGFCGLSMIAAPDGRVLAEAQSHGEAVVEAEIDLDMIEAERAREPALGMRRPELYDSR
jgi:predicted amidohydrolase